MTDSQEVSEPLPHGHADAIESAVSKERLARYISLADGDKVEGIRLYQHNTLISEALYGPLQWVEILVRNAFNVQLCKSFGDEWFNHLLTLKPFEKDEEGKLPICALKILNAKEELQKKSKPVTAGRMVAELSFGFWVGICARPYMEPLWIPCLRHPFKARRLSRADVHLRLDDIRLLRNRVAHHECILQRNLRRDYASLVETAQWICGASASWMETNNRVLAVLDNKSIVVAPLQSRSRLSS